MKNQKLYESIMHGINKELPKILLEGKSNVNAFSSKKGQSQLKSMADMIIKHFEEGKHYLPKTFCGNHGIYEVREKSYDKDYFFWGPLGATEGSELGPEYDMYKNYAGSYNAYYGIHFWDLNPSLIKSLESDRTVKKSEITNDLVLYDKSSNIIRIPYKNTIYKDNNGYILILFDRYVFGADIYNTKRDTAKLLSNAQLEQYKRGEFNDFHTLCTFLIPDDSANLKIDKNLIGKTDSKSTILDVLNQFVNANFINKDQVDAMYDDMTDAIMNAIADNLDDDDDDVAESIFNGLVDAGIMAPFDFTHV